MRGETCPCRPGPPRGRDPRRAAVGLDRPRAGAPRPMARPAISAGRGKRAASSTRGSRPRPHRQDPHHHHRPLRAPAPDRRAERAPAARRRHGPRGDPRPRRHPRPHKRREPLGAPRRRRRGLRHRVRAHATGSASTSSRASRACPPAAIGAFEPARRHGRLAPLFGQRLDREPIAAHRSEIGRAVEAPRSRTATPSLVLREPSADLRQNSLAAALREVGRAPRTLSTPRRSQGARASPARHRRARRRRGPRRPRARRGPPPARPRRATAASRTSGPAPPRGGVVTAAIVLFDCRCLGRAIAEPRRSGGRIDDALVAQLSPLGLGPRRPRRATTSGPTPSRWTTDGLMPLALTGQGRSSVPLP